jgi:hypothetical protein
MTGGAPGHTVIPNERFVSPPDGTDTTTNAIDGPGALRRGPTTALHMQSKAIDWTTDRVCV